MAKCIVCGTKEVKNYGDVCEVCMLLEDNYENTTKLNEIIVRDKGNNEISSNVKSDLSNHIQSEKVISKNLLVSGVVKNVEISEYSKIFFIRWFSSLINGHCLSLNKKILLFQVYPDFEGKHLSENGFSCTQVIVYGKVNQGSICENNIVTVYGKRDSKNNIIANKIVNDVSGSIVKPALTIPYVVVLAISLLFFVFGVMLGISEGVEGIIIFSMLMIVLFNFKLAFKLMWKTGRFLLQTLWMITNKIN